MSDAADRARGHGGWLMVLLVVAAAVIVILGSYKVWYHYQTVGLGYQLAEETIRHRRLFGKNRKLRIELASLQRDGLQRVRRTAGWAGAEDEETGREDDGTRTRMRLPGPEDLIVVQPGARER